MGVGDFADVNTPAAGAVSSNRGGGIGGAVRPLNPTGGFAPNGAWSNGPTINGQQPGTPMAEQGGLGGAILQQYQQMQSQRPGPMATPTPEPTLEQQLEGWRTIGEQDALSPRYQQHQLGNVYDQNFAAQLGLLGLNYQQGVGYATQDNALNQQMLGLRRQLLGVENQNTGVDKNALANRQAGLGRDTEFLQQQRGLYDQQLANQLGQIDTRYALDRLDHENQYAAGGSWFTPGQKFRGDKLSEAAEQNREAARLGTQQSQLGVDRSLNNNQTQMQDYGFDMQKLDNRLAANGINLQMLGVNGQQLNLALQKRIDDLGLSQWMDATQLLNTAAQGGGQQSDYALQMIMDWLGGGAVGPIPQAPIGR